MCGRFAVKKKASEVADDIEALWAEYDADLEESFNVAPTDSAAVLVDGSLEKMSWGLVPYWAKDSLKRASMINARSETITEKSAFKELPGKRQCILPCHGYFEWQRKGDSKVPYYLYPEDGEYLYLAGLWDLWHVSPTKVIKSFTLLTQEASESILEVHHRMPLMLDLETARDWASNQLELAEAVVKSRCQLTYHEVSSKVNSARNKEKSLIEAVESPQFWQDELF